MNHMEKLLSLTDKNEINKFWDSLDDEEHWDLYCEVTRMKKKEFPDDEEIDWEYQFNNRPDVVPYPDCGNRIETERWDMLDKIAYPNK